MVDYQPTVDNIDPVAALIVSVTVTVGDKLRHQQIEMYGYMDLRSIGSE